MFYALSFVSLLFVLSAVRAVRDQHLVVLRWPIGYFFLERGPDGRYTIFSPARIPMVIARYGTAVALAGLTALRGRVWVGTPARRVATAR